MQNNPPIFVSRLVGILTASFAKVGDLLFYQDEVGADLYFMVAGRVNLLITFMVSEPCIPTGAITIGANDGLRIRRRGPFGDNVDRFTRAPPSCRSGNAVLEGPQQGGTALSLPAVIPFPRWRGPAQSSRSPQIDRRQESVPLGILSWG